MIIKPFLKNVNVMFMTQNCYSFWPAPQQHLFEHWPPAEKFIWPNYEIGCERQKTIANDSSQTRPKTPKTQIRKRRMKHRIQFHDFHNRFQFVSISFVRSSFNPKWKIHSSPFAVFCVHSAYALCLCIVSRYFN